MPTGSSAREMGIQTFGVDEDAEQAPGADAVDAACLFVRHSPRVSGASFGMSAASSKRSFFAVVVTCILVVAVASFVPAYLRARSTPSAAPCVVNLMQIAGAKASWALDNRKSTNDMPVWDDIKPFLKPGMSCPQRGTYILGRVGEPPRCSLGGPSHRMPQ